MPGGLTPPEPNHSKYALWVYALASLGDSSAIAGDGDADLFVAFATK